MKVRTLADLDKEAARLWKEACRFDNIDPKSSFVSFSLKNPFLKDLHVQKARLRLRGAMNRVF